mmetsp:Transcript_21552/g.53141  ORF Transcript_21552/g.53141 Transcript_21552/m.53141 type:complete len:145 (+) Transcript_21552:152-586(+)
MNAAPFPAFSSEPVARYVCTDPTAVHWLFSDALPPLSADAYDFRLMVHTSHSFVTPDVGPGGGAVSVGVEHTVACHEVRANGLAFGTQFEDRRKRRDADGALEDEGGLLALTKLVAVFDKSDVQYMFVNRTPEGGWVVSTHRYS